MKWWLPGAGERRELTFNESRISVLPDEKVLEICFATIILNTLEWYLRPG